MKEIADKVQKVFDEQDEKYSRIIREYATVKDIPGNRELAEQYIQEMRMDTFKQIQELVGEPSEKNSSKPFSDLTKEKLMEYAGIIPLIQAEIGGTEDRELSELIEKYDGTEWAPLLQTLLKPRLKELRESGPEKARIANDLARRFSPVPDEKSQLRERFLGDIKTLLFFGNGKSITVGVRQNQEGRFLLGNGERRNVSVDLAQAAADFSLLGKKAEPLVKSRTVGSKTIREVEYCYKWNQ